MISEFDKVRIENIEEEANPGHYVSVDATGKLFKYAIPLKPIADAWPIGGLNVRGYGTNVPILGIYYTAPPETVTMLAAPTTANWLRRDTVAVNTLNRIVILPGTPGLVGAAPIVDLNLYFPIRDLVLLANATEPVDPITLTGNSNEFVLFAETGTVAGGEANVSGSAASIAVTVNTQIAGAKSIEATNVQKLHEARFEYLELKSTVGQTHFIYKLKLKAAVQTSKYWFFRLYNGNTTIGNFLFKHGQYGFNANELGVQYLSIPIEVTPFKNVSYTKATLFFYHGFSTIPGYYIDDVKFLNSLPTIVYADQVQSDWNETDQNKVTYIKGRFDQTLKEDKANKGIADGYAPLNASVKIAATYLDIVNNLIDGGIDKLLSAEQGTVLKSQIDAIYILLASDNINLDTVQEIVDAIETVQLSLSTILVNDLTTGGVTKALTAEMGVALKGLYDALVLVVTDKVDKIDGKGLSTNDYTTLEKQTLAKFTVPLTQDLIPVSQLDGSIVWQTAPSGGGGDMILDDVQTVTGAKDFLNAKFLMRNVANTFSSYFTNANTAQRIYTLPNKAGTVAMTSDILAQLNGVVNYLVKFGTATTGVISRLLDTGTFFGIGTSETPTKDITLGNQDNRNIGVELSDSSTIGRDLTISAGKTINYVLNSSFQALGLNAYDWNGMGSSLSGNIYLTANANGQGIWKQTGGVGNFVKIITGGGSWEGICGDINNNIYAVVFGGGIFMQTNETGAFNSLGQTSRNWTDVASHPNGDIYACVSNGDIYKQTGGVGNFVGIGGISRDWNGIEVHPNGNIYAIVKNGDIYMQTAGSGTFNPLGVTSRRYESIAISPSGNVYVGVWGSFIWIQVGGAGAFTQLTGVGIISGYWFGLTSDNNSNIYGVIWRGDVWKQINYALGTPNLNGGTLIHEAGTGKGIGESNDEVWTGQKTASGTDMQVLTLRQRIDNQGITTKFFTPVYADNASAIAGGLIVGMEYRTATGIKMEVY